MPTSTYVPLATLTLTGNDSSIVFSSIPATYRDLVIAGNVRSTRAATTEDLFMELNGDTTSSYSAVYMYGAGTPASFTASGTYVVVATNTAAASQASGLFSPVNFSILDASATDKHKTILSRNGGGAQDQVWSAAGRYASNTAINSITLYYNIASVAAGTTLTLYGIAA
jgi:hypothetical protein